MSILQLEQMNMLLLHAHTKTCIKYKRRLHVRLYVTKAVKAADKVARPSSKRVTLHVHLSARLLYNTDYTDLLWR